MGLSISGIETSAKQLAKAFGKKNILMTKPNSPIVNFGGLTYKPALTEDVVQISKKTFSPKKEIEEMFKGRFKDEKRYEAFLKTALPHWNKDTKAILGCFEDVHETQLEQLVDTLRRRNHTVESVKSIVGANPVKIDKKILNTLEFPRFQKFKNISLEDFDKLTVEEKKELINGFASCKLYAGENNVQNIPDMKIFDNLRNSYKKREFTFEELQLKENKILSMSEANKERAEFERIYQDTLQNMLSKIPRGKKHIPNTKLEIVTGKKLDIKPPLSNSTDDIKTVKKTIDGYEVRVGEIDKNSKRFMVHGFDEKSLVRLEAMQLTDPNLVLCTGYIGGKGCIKGERISAIVTPKNPGEQLVQANEDISSGYGAIKNLFNIQNKYLDDEVKTALSAVKKENANSFLPVKIREKLGLSVQDYNKRLQHLGNAKHLEDVKKADEELYNTIINITNEETLFEGIMRPNVEAILMPSKDMPVGKNVLDYCERYDIPLLFQA